MHCAMAVAFRERWALRQVGLGRGHCLGAPALYVLRVDQAPQPTGESVNAQMPQTPAMSAQMSASAFVGGQSPSAQQQQMQMQGGMMGMGMGSLAVACRRCRSDGALE